MERAYLEVIKTLLTCETPGNGKKKPLRIALESSAVGGESRIHQEYYVKAYVYIMLFGEV